MGILIGYPFVMMMMTMMMVMMTMVSLMIMMTTIMMIMVTMMTIMMGIGIVMMVMRRLERRQTSWESNFLGEPSTYSEISYLWAFY